MTNEEKKTKIEEVLDTTIFKVLSVDQVNHNPHPFTVGPKHITHASKHHGGMLGQATLDAVGCAHPHCNLPHDQHKYDTVAFLQFQRNTTKEEAQTALKKVVDHIGEGVVDGFTFVETKEKYRAN